MNPQKNPSGIHRMTCGFLNGTTSETTVKASLIGIGLSFLCAACAPAPMDQHDAEQHRGMPRPVRWNLTLLGPARQISAKQAMAKWNSALGSQQLIADDSSPNYVFVGSIPSVGLYTYVNGVGTITIDSHRNWSDCFTDNTTHSAADLTFEHEFGHSLGAKDTTNPPDVMYMYEGSCRPLTTNDINQAR